jgi:hypothetical protein
MKSFTASYKAHTLAYILIRNTTIKTYVVATIITICVTHVSACVRSRVSLYIAYIMYFIILE